MNCCNHNKNSNNNGHKHSRLGHMWMMLLCCGAPIILLAVVSVIGPGFTGARSVLSGIAPLLCPIMMVIMIPMMLRKEKSSDRNCCESQTQQIENESTEGSKLMK